MASVPDGSVILPFLARRAYSARIGHEIRMHRLLLSSVVEEEALVGARDGFERRRYESFFAGFRREGLLLTPLAAEWRACGHLISRYGQRFGRVLARDHQNDVLILLSALRAARDEPTTLLTENDADFQTWLRLLPRQSGLRIEATLRG